jgi:hypothetical protein
MLNLYDVAMNVHLNIWVWLLQFFSSKVFIFCVAWSSFCACDAFRMWDFVWHHLNTVARERGVHRAAWCLLDPGWLQPTVLGSGFWTLTVVHCSLLSFRITFALHCSSSTLCLSYQFPASDAFPMGNRICPLHPEYQELCFFPQSSENLSFHELC